MERLIDLDAVAHEIGRRRQAWVSLGVDVGQLTWCDIDSRWPWRPTTDRSSIGAPVSLGVVVSRNELLVTEVCLWSGGWADVDGIVGGEPVGESPRFEDVPACVAVVEAVVHRIARAPF